MTNEERDYLFDQGLALSSILERVCVELLGMMENIDNRVEISRSISKLEAEGDDVFHAANDRLRLWIWVTMIVSRSFRCCVMLRMSSIW